MVKNSLKTQSGQATTEYILMLVVTVSIVLGLASQFYKPFGKWTQFWLGDYVNCLLDKGELPALLSPSATDICPQDDQYFTEGRGNRPEDPNRRPPIAGRSSDGQRSGNSSAGAGSSSGYAGSAGRESSSGGTDGPAASSKTTKVANVETDSDSRFFNSRRGFSTSASQGRQISQMSVESLISLERDKIKRRESRIFKITNVDLDEGTGRSNKTMRVALKDPNKIDKELEIEAWSFGKLFRLAIILIIIVFTILFLFMQGVRISKSLEKSD